MNILKKVLLQFVFVTLFLELLFLAFYFNLPSYLISDGLTKVEAAGQGSVLGIQLYDRTWFAEDWLPPQVGIKEPDRDLYYAGSEFSLSSTEKIVESELPAGWKLKGELQIQDMFYYVLTTGSVQDGSHNLKLKFYDASGNLTEREVKLRAHSGRFEVMSWDNFSYSAYPYHLLSLVSKKYKLPQDFVPPDLVSLSSLGIRNNNDSHLRKDAAKALQELTRHVDAAGIDYTIASAFRSYEQQVTTYGFWIGYYGGDVAAADLVSARPGFSEHQLGTTVDFLTSANNNTFAGFQFTSLGIWLSQNAYKFGFVISYPEGQTAITGYTFEPWHYRYIGKENAEKFHSSGLTLIEWLENEQESLRSSYNK